MVGKFHKVDEICHPRKLPRLSPVKPIFGNMLEGKIVFILENMIMVSLNVKHIVILFTAYKKYTVIMLIQHKKVLMSNG